MGNTTIQANSLKAWILACRPKTLTGALIPVLLAGGLAWHDGCFAPDRWICCTLFACLMQIVSNLINDLFDFQKGTDREDRLGPERACAQGWITPGAMKIGIGMVLVLAAIAGISAVVLSWKLLPFQGLEFVVLGAVCMLFAFLYTTHLSYLGLGDLLVLVFFGFVPVLGTYYIQALTLTPAAWTLGLISGVAIDALLIINNYRDRDQDRISGKKTIIVRWGDSFGIHLYLGIGVLTFFLINTLLPFCITNASEYLFLLLNIPAILYLILHFITWRRMVQIGSGRALNSILGETSRNMFLMALLLSIVLVIL